MTELVAITLENEMDLTLAYKRSMLTAAMLGLTVATQTAFATAVSEVCREVIDKAIEGVAILGTTNDSGRFTLTANISFVADEEMKKGSAGFEYARKLVPVLEINFNSKRAEIVLQLAIPRATKIDQNKVNAVKKQIENDGPVSAYEEVKQRNAVLADLTQQQELALHQADLLHQKKNEFLSVASHELNSPLTVLRSYAQIALMVEGGRDPVLRAHLKKVEQQTGKLVKLIKQLMDISKMENGSISYDMQPVSIHAFFNSAIEAISLLVQTHQVELELGADEMIHADLLRLEQVISNIVGNAAKYSPSGSIIRIVTSIADGQLTIAIADQGIGMSPESQKKVFEKFYRDKQVEKKYSGLGMGLYIASRIISDHQGTIRVSSQEGIGSVFYCDLPVLA